MDTILKSISRQLPGISIKAGESLCWSPQTHTITYKLADKSPENIWGLLHEAGHANLGHNTYLSDIELLMLEAAAWEEALRLGKIADVTIDPEHIQDCLDTYRDWLHQRSTCPRCGIVSFEATTGQYECYNCHKAWVVSSSRLCRSYRLGADQTKNRPEPLSQAVFHTKRV